jgi:hypothetical protein
LIKLTDILTEILLEKKLCKKGEAYRQRRMKPKIKGGGGEKSSAYLSARASKVCQGLMEKDDSNNGIDPEEATTNLSSVQTLADKKRDIAFIVRKGDTPQNWKRVEQIIQDNDIRTMYVKGNPYDAYVAYLPGSENKATQLKDLAEKYNGYLSSNATAEDTRKIGQLLGYDKDKIEQFIKDRYIDESLKETSHDKMIKCRKCGWEWKLSQGGKDPFVCHKNKCGYDNSDFYDNILDESLDDWFEEDWVRIDTQGNITGPCGTMKKGKATTRCLPRAKANRLTKDERAATARKKAAGSKKGKQFVPNTEKAKVKFKK